MQTPWAEGLPHNPGDGFSRPHGASSSSSHLCPPQQWVFGVLLQPQICGSSGLPGKHQWSHSPTPAKWANGERGQGPFRAIAEHRL